MVSLRIATSSKNLFISLQEQLIDIREDGGVDQLFVARQLVLQRLNWITLRDSLLVQVL